MESVISVLIVDDHNNISEPLAQYLRKFGFEVEIAADGKSMRQRLGERAFSLILLDIMLPGEDGLSLCRYVSEHVGTSVILLTAVTEQADRVAGLEIGADDYVTKPFDPRELIARIRSVLRRSQAVIHKHSAASRLPDRVQLHRFNGWVLNVELRELRDPMNRIIPLSTAEFHLLRALAEHSNRVLSRSQLLDLTQRGEVVVFDRSIDSQISRLRKKLERDPRHPNMLKTVRGDGYMLASSTGLSAA